MPPRLNQVTQAQLLRYAVRMHDHFRHEVAVLHGEVVVVIALLDLLLYVLLATVIICTGIHRRKELLEALTQVCVLICLYSISSLILRLFSYEMWRLNLSVRVAVAAINGLLQPVKCFVKLRDWAR